jgi:hypothetical protein
MKAILLAAMAFVVVATLGYFSAAQRPELSADARFALQHFLDVDCEVNEQGEALNRMLTFRAELEPHLIAILRDGPDKQTLDEAQRSLEEQWNVREAYLRKNPDLGLKENELQIAKGQTRDAFLTEGRERIIRKYREKSAIGLAAIGSPEAIKTLREVSEKGDEALRTVIQAALQKYQKK